MKNRSREIIDFLGLRKVDVANSMGITTVGLNQILNTEKPKIETLERLANAINVPVWKLYLTDEEIDEISLLRPKAEKGNIYNISGIIVHNDRPYQINSISDIEDLLRKIKEEKG